MKGIILSGGTGSRLYPMTKVVSKQLLPVFDKPMVYYPLSVLMMAGIRDILIISTPKDLPLYQELLGGGGQWGLYLSYAEQPSPEGLAQAFIIGREHVGRDNVCMILGDNLFYGETFPRRLVRARSRTRGATIFCYRVKDPERYGVVSFDKSGRVTGIQEKPARPQSSYAVTGLYFYDNRVLDIAANLKPSARGELEITDVNQAYLNLGDLQVETLSRGIAWFDAGTPESMIQASAFIATLEQRQGVKVACLEEVAFRLGFIDAAKLEALAEPLRNTDYGKYLLELLKENGRPPQPFPNG